MTSIVAIFDLDGTLSQGRIWEGFLKYYLKHKKKRAWILVFWATHSALWLLSKCKLINKENCRAKWTEDLAGVFKGASTEEVLEVFHWVANNYVFDSWRSDVVEILDQHKQRGHIVVIVSAAYGGLLRLVGKRLEVPNVIGTELEVLNGKHTGKVVEPLCFGENKAKLFQEFINRTELQIDSPSSFAYADSIFDAPLLRLVGNPVATYPDKELRRLAEHNGWRILP